MVYSQQLAETQYRINDSRCAALSLHGVIYFITGSFPLLTLFIHSAHPDPLLLGPSNLFSVSMNV